MWLPRFLPGTLLILGLVGGRGALVASSTGLLELSLGKFRNVLLNKTIQVEAVIRNIASTASVIIFQVHSHQKNITISFNKNLFANSSGTGVDEGLVSILRPQQNVCTWYLQSLDASQVLGTAVSFAYTERDPIPGGCNLEFNLEVDPNIYLEYNLIDTRIKFAPANLGYARGANPPSCDSDTGQNSRWRLRYDIYQYFLPENDLSETVLLSHLRKMSEVQSIRANGIRLVSLTTEEKTNVHFSSLPGQGVIYNVIVWDPLWNTSAAYVPVHTYACSLTDLVENCSSLGRLSTKIFFTIFAVLGLFICFFGHRFWKTDLFYMGFIVTGFFSFILFTRITSVSYDVCLILTAVAGLVGGLLLVASWWRFGFVLFCMLIVGLVLGFFFSSVIFFTPLGDYKVFHDDAVFWVTFSCIALMVPVVFVGCPRILNILACGIVGSYSVVLAIACYLYTSLAYITLDVLRRILNDDFRQAYTNVPFQTNDLIILAVWGMLAVCGITVQLRRERREIPFPPHPYRIWKRERERRITNILDPSHHIPPLRERIHNKLSQIKEFFRKEQPAGERTPLLL
ncbi:transmembrane 7 superfamily member 3 [Pelodiscus sinensis]|uniref:Transmembrane 7 superfamily member 3 n=1 Tax=Pelodiscus sinensis TaxID=13735 RepID=K7FIS5_PELSI|nr:transmembrane 7 superfamily member 3 [Pelodiscus sinensis]|eukprot:XP_006127743.1 transmembrane 7 superfamily member 3 [Pelodiscus sinensis]